MKKYEIYILANFLEQKKVSIHHILHRSCSLIKPYNYFQQKGPLCARKLHFRTQFCAHADTIIIIKKSFNVQQKMT